MPSHSLTHSQFGHLLSGTLEEVKARLAYYERSNAERRAQTTFVDAAEYEGNKIMMAEDARRIKNLRVEIAAREARPADNARIECRYIEWKNNPPQRLEPIFKGFR